MSDDDATDEGVAPGRPDHPARPPTDDPTPDEADGRYVTGEGGADAAGGEEAEVDDTAPTPGVFTRILDRVPAWVADLGAGCLLASTIITFILAAFSAYALATGWYGSLGLSASRTLLMVVVFGIATVFQGAAVRWARRRVRWMWVMLAAAMGMLSIVGAPFALPGAAFLFVSKRHFAMSTPMGLIGDEGEEADEGGEAEDAA